jgi:PRTRC genetic system protein A
MMMNNLVTYHITTEAHYHKLGSLYTYWFAGNGTFISAARQGLAVSFPIARCEVRGLPPLEPYFKYDYPKIKREVIERMLYYAQIAAQDELEQLYHVCFDGEVMRLEIPEQEQTRVSCKPLDDSAESSLHRSIIEIHSHNTMRAWFSKQDDEDEKGFKIYGVVGKVLHRPEIKFRVGLHGYFWNIPAELVCELPDEIFDLNSN